MRRIVAVFLILSLFPISEITLKAYRIELKDITSAYEKETGDAVRKKPHTFGRIVLWTIAAATIGTVVYFIVIKKPEFILKVEIGIGVEGLPAVGEYKYKKGSTVNYDFRKLAGYSNLTVTLDGSPVAASGKVLMDKEHTLKATALEIGNYTSITLQIRFVFKGMNTGGDESLFFERKRFRSGSYYTTRIGAANSNCEDAELLIDDTQIWTIDKPSLYCSQLYYYGSINVSYPFFICPEIQISVLSYQWESGKADPGSPVIKNPQDIVFDKNKMCRTLPGGAVNCESQVTLEFIRPSNPQTATRVFTVGCK